MTEQQFDEKLAALEEEAESLNDLRTELVLEIGEKAYAELSGRPELAELVAKIAEVEEKAGYLKQQQVELAEEKALFEKEEKERIARRTCIKCRAVNPEDAKFCEECGQGLGILPREYCTNCGTMNPTGLKFCGECGTKLDE